MPLDVIQINRGKQESIFEKLNPFVEKLVGAYKQKKLNEWDNEWMSAMLSDIEIAGSKKSIDASILKKDPPEGFIDVEGMTSFADEAVGMLQQKEAMLGGVTKPTEQAIKTELLPDVKEFNELYQFVSELPTGKVDWANTRGVFRKRLESGRAIGEASKSILSMILGQGVTDQRQKFEQDFDLATRMKQELYPETEEEGVIFDPNQFLEDNPNMDVTGYNSNTGGYTFKRKEEEEGKPEIDFDKLNKFLSDNNMKLKGVSVNPTTGNLNYSFGAKPETEKPFEQIIKEAKEYVKSNPGTEIKNINFATESVSVGQEGKDEPEPGTKKIIPTYGVIQTINKDLLDPTKDPNTVRSQAGVKYDFTNENTKMVTNEERANRFYNDASADLNDPNILDEEGYLQKPFEAGNKTLDPVDLYTNMYNLYEQGARELYNETGQILPKEYLSLEEAGKYTSLTWGTGEKGGYKPVKNTENIPWSWEDKTQEVYDQMAKEGLTIKDMNSEALAKDGVDINKLLQMFNQ